MKTKGNPRSIKDSKADLSKDLDNVISHMYIHTVNSHKNTNKEGKMELEGNLSVDPLRILMASNRPAKFSLEGNIQASDFCILGREVKLEELCLGMNVVVTNRNKRITIKRGYVSSIGENTVIVSEEINSNIISNCDINMCDKDIRLFEV